MAQVRASRSGQFRRSSSTENKMCPDDFEDISLDTTTDSGVAATSTPYNHSFSDSSSTKSISSRDSACSSTLDEDYDTDATSTTNSVLIDPHKLNGYAINSLKSQSTNSLHGVVDAKLRPASQPATTATNTTTTAAATTTNNGLNRQRSMGSLRQQRPSSQPNAPGGARRRGSVDNLQSGAAAPLPSRNQVLRKAVTTVGDTRQQHSFDEEQAIPHHRLKSRTGSVRLTRKQIEAQFDAEYNDDVIDDSCIWNVPLSPALYAKSRQQAAIKRQHSLPHQPQRTPPQQQQSQPQHHSNQQRVKSMPSNMKAKSQSCLHEMPIISETEVMTVDENTEQEPQEGLEGLDDDTQDLTRKFGEMPAVSQSYDMRPKTHRRSTDPVDPADTTSSSQRSSVSSNGGGSQTRPAWLPPKSPEEERKHMQEFYKLIEHTAQADKKREEKRKSEQSARQRQEQKDEQDWLNKVIPDFERQIKESRVREMWWRGIPSKLRERVWKMKVGNHLGITQDSFNSLCKQPLSRQVSAQIHRDANETYPSLHIFGDGGPLNKDLTDVLKAYVGLRPDVGYQPGMSSIAAVFLLNLPPFDAFVLFANTLDGSMSMSIYKNDERTLNGYYTSFLKVLNTKLPKLYQHFQDLHLPPSRYLQPFLMSWFTQHLSIDIVSRIWDVMIFEGDGFLLRVALGVLTVLEWKLYGKADEVLQELNLTAAATTTTNNNNNNTLLDVGDEDTFMGTVRQALKANV